MKSFSKDILTAISKEIDSLSLRYKSLLNIGDFNCEIHKESMSNFCQIYGFENLINDPTCKKSLKTPTCVGLMMTNKLKCFQNSIRIETGLSGC